MKIKKIHILRPEVTAEIKRPILGRLYLIYVRIKFIKVVRANLMLSTAKKGERGYIKPIRAYFIAIPKIKVGGAGD